MTKIMNFAYSDTLRLQLLVESEKVFNRNPIRIWGIQFFWNYGHPINTSRDLSIQSDHTTQTISKIKLWSMKST